MVYLYKEKHFLWLILTEGFGAQYILEENFLIIFNGMMKILFRTA